LSERERRLLGVLVEKAKTTPDSYPMSVNALVTGSNQKSNRDPLMDLDDIDVEESLTGLQKKGLVTKITGGRVERWKHELYAAWKADKIELAVLAELLLRGPQTEGELRGRASRMEPIDDLDKLREILKPLADRKLVVYLSPEGRRGTVLTHGFHDPRELVKARQTAASMPAEIEPVQAPRPVPAPPPPVQSGPTAGELIAPLERRLNEALAEIAKLRTDVTRLDEQLTTLRRELGAG
jgi:uncharacterized protein YceH (UPF0502 family)